MSEEVTFASAETNPDLYRVVNTAVVLVWVINKLILCLCANALLSAILIRHDR